MLVYAGTGRGVWGGENERKRKEEKKEKKKENERRWGECDNGSL